MFSAAVLPDSPLLPFRLPMIKWDPATEIYEGTVNDPTTRTLSPSEFKMVAQVLPLDLRAPALRGPRPIRCLHDFRLARAAPRWRVRQRLHYPQLYQGYISCNLVFVICLLTPLWGSSLTLSWWVAFICLDL